MKDWHRETTVANQLMLFHDANLSSGTAENRAVCFGLKSAFCVLASFRVHSSKEAFYDWSPRERKPVLCVLGIEKQPTSV